MTAIAVVAAEVGAVFGIQAEIIDMIAGATITAGQVVYQNTSGRAALADANATGLEQARGIALKGAVSGQVVPVLKKGGVEGFTVSGMNGDAVAYLSDTAGALDDAAGTLTVVCGRVLVLPDGNNTKILYVDFSWAYIWA
jgi:hypothetical protein